MAQISSFGALPDPSLHLSSGTNKTSSALGTSKSTTSQFSPPTTDHAEASPLQAQLTRLGSVLSGLQQNAAANHAHYIQTLNKVKSGTYNVDSLGVSKSIIKDLLGK